MKSVHSLAIGRVRSIEEAIALAINEACRLGIWVRFIFDGVVVTVSSDSKSELVYDWWLTQSLTLHAKRVSASLKKSKKNRKPGNVLNFRKARTS